LPRQNDVDMKDIPAWMSATNPLVKNGRLFMTSFKEIEGGRLDPVNTLYLGKRAQSTKYKNTVLKDIAYIEKGQSITSNKINGGKYPVIAGGKSSPYSHKEYNYEGNVITISASGAYAGYAWFHDYPIFASDCNVIRSKNEDKYLTKYIFEVLRVQQKQIYMLQQGAGQPHVYLADLAKLLIPAVSANMQNVICKHIDELQNRAKHLQNEVANILKTAKSQIEQMIISK
jgi:type I restriction enzyme, S subunit